jgi:hypothetical protein
MAKGCLYHDPEKKRYKENQTLFHFYCLMLISEKPKKSYNISTCYFVSFYVLTMLVEKEKRLKKGVYKNIKCHCGVLAVLRGWSALYIFSPQPYQA